MVVQEKVGTQKQEERLTVESWFGSQPLLARPEVRQETQAIEHLRPQGIDVVRERQGHVSLREQGLARELLGVTFSVTLGHDRSAQFQDPSLRLVCRGGRVVTVVSPGLGASGRHLRDLLIAATLRLRREHPEAGLPHEPQRPTRCPQCGRPHVMVSGVPCPGCGAFAGVRW
jgi:hypothetical protein